MISLTSDLRTHELRDYERKLWILSPDKVGGKGAVYFGDGTNFTISSTFYKTKDDD
jgi:hypothetical protein